MRKATDGPIRLHRDTNTASIRRLYLRWGIRWRSHQQCIHNVGMDLTLRLSPESFNDRHSRLIELALPLGGAAAAATGTRCCGGGAASTAGDATPQRISPFYNVE